MFKSKKCLYFGAEGVVISEYYSNHGLYNSSPYSKPSSAQPN
jgi:hypothetical protein